MLLPSFPRPHSPSPLACPMQPDRFPPSGRSMAEGFEVRSQPTDQPSGPHNRVSGATDGWAVLPGASALAAKPRRGRLQCCPVAF